MNREETAGLEVKPPTGLETGPEAVTSPLDAHKFYAEASTSNYGIYPPQSQYKQLETTKKSRRRACWALAVIAIVCVAISLGAGLGAGLAAQHKSSSPSSTTTINADSARVTVTQSGDSYTITSISSAHASPSCPAANGSTYVASNKPTPVESSQVTQTSFPFEILCDKNTAEGGNIVDMQLISNVSSLNDCVEQCALFNFRTRQEYFPKDACTGVSWGYGTNLDPIHTCWLKSNVTLGSPNNTETWPGYDGAVLLTDLR